MMSLMLRSARMQSPLMNNKHYVSYLHSQHRGRLCLPFADDDSKTAEVVSKVLLLARDHGIQGAAILK